MKLKTTRKKTSEKMQIFKVDNKINFIYLNINNIQLP